jgi:hypothetical protein
VVAVKIIYSDNIPTDTSDEHLWLDDLPDDRLLLQRICDKLNERLIHYEHGQYYKFVADEHELYKWEP